ncbi:MAG: hypothetical protein IPM52_12295 [Bacteroidetes bacterium]|nr:hypothetical protein [Bacteroidota bacterium]
MKKQIVLVLLVCSALYVEAQTVAQKNSKPRLEVYYTHATNRCPGCRAIEKETTETLNTMFKDKMNKGEIVLHIVNVDLKENQAIAEQLQAWGSGLYLVKAGESKPSVDLTREGFSLARSKPAEFRTVLAGHIERLLRQ